MPKESHSRRCTIKLLCCRASDAHAEFDQSMTLSRCQVMQVLPLLLCISALALSCQILQHWFAEHHISCLPQQEIAPTLRRAPPYMSRLICEATCEGFLAEHPFCLSGCVWILADAVINCTFNCTMSTLKHSVCSTASELRVSFLIISTPECAV